MSFALTAISIIVTMLIITYLQMNEETEVTATANDGLTHITIKDFDSWCEEHHEVYWTKNENAFAENDMSEEDMDTTEAVTDIKQTTGVVTDIDLDAIGGGMYLDVIVANEILRANINKAMKKGSDLNEST